MLTASFNQALMESEGNQKEEAKRGAKFTGDMRWLCISAPLLSSTLLRTDSRTSPPVISHSWYGQFVLKLFQLHTYTVFIDLLYKY